VNLLDRFLTARSRTAALAMAYVIFVGVVVLVALQIGSRVVDQAKAFTADFPNRIAALEKPNPNLPQAINNLKAQMVERVRRQIAEGSSDLFAAMARTGLKFITVASDVIYIVIIPILAFFFLKDAGLMRDHILAMVDQGPRRELLDDVMADVHLLLAHYMRALVLLSLAAFTAYTIAFAIIGVPYAILLGALAGVLEFIPMLGPLAAAIAILVVAAVAGAHVLVVLIFILAYRVFQDYILSPHLMGHGVEIHPLLVLFGVFAGAEIAGIPGTFLSVPVLALARIIYLRIRKARMATQLRPDTEVTL
jgi:predicted PurR-regulated permease PerM